MKELFYAIDEEDGQRILDVDEDHDEEPVLRFHMPHHPGGAPDVFLGRDDVEGLCVAMYGWLERTRA